MPEIIEIINVSADFHVYDEEFERMEFFHHESVRVSDAEQMYQILELLAEGVLENAREVREFAQPDWSWHRGAFEGHNPSIPSLSVWFQIEREMEARHVPFWDSPHIWGEPAQRLYEQLLEWGIMDEPPEPPEPGDRERMRGRW